MPTDIPTPKDPLRSTQRGPAPLARDSSEYPEMKIDGRDAEPTPVRYPQPSHLQQSMPIPPALERFIQRMLEALTPLGEPERFMRQVIIDGVKAAFPRLIATRTAAAVAAKLMQVVSEEM